MFLPLSAGFGPHSDRSAPEVRGAPRFEGQRGTCRAWRSALSDGLDRQHAYQIFSVKPQVNLSNIEAKSLDIV